MFFAQAEAVFSPQRLIIGRRSSPETGTGDLCRCFDRSCHMMSIRPWLSGAKAIRPCAQSRFFRGSFWYDGRLATLFTAGVSLAEPW